jgi:glycosyltransferase involved in cell wall biosynthesis
MDRCLKPIVVISGVNLTEMGPLAVFRDAIASFGEHFSDKYHLVVLVHKRELFDQAGVEYREFPEIKRNWFNRMRFEFIESKRISEELQPYLWLCMHDISARVVAQRQAVYCHNPSMFYPVRWNEFQSDWKFVMFQLFYSHLYGLNIASNRYVVVQQDWLRKEMVKRYGIKNVIVAHPDLSHMPVVPSRIVSSEGRPYQFFYPALARTFKNHEIILKAVQILEEWGITGYQVDITVNPQDTVHAAKLYNLYRDVKHVRWLGSLPRSEVFTRYQESDCMLFPSFVETWGMPITEFKQTGKLIFSADLAYAHETVGNYDHVAFFNPNSPDELAHLMRRAIAKQPSATPHSVQEPAAPYASNWRELWSFLLTDRAG